MNIKHTINIFLGSFVWYNIAEFNTQDNLTRSTDKDWEWKQNLDVNNSNCQTYGGSRISDTEFLVFSDIPIKTIRLNRFKYPYKVKRISSTKFIISSKCMQEHFNNTDIVRVLIRVF